MFPTSAPTAPTPGAGDDLDVFSFAANTKNNSNPSKPAFGMAAPAPGKENNPVPDANPIPSDWKPSSGPVSASNFYGDAKRTIDVKPYKNPYNNTSTFGGVGGKRKSSEPLQPSNVVNQSNSSFGQSGFRQSQSSNSSTGRGTSSKRFKKGERDPNQPTIMSMFNKRKEKAARTFFLFTSAFEHEVGRI